MAPLSQDLRKRLIRAVEAGSSAREAAARFAVSASAAIKLVHRVRTTGSTEPAKIGGCRQPLLAGHEDAIARAHHDAQGHHPGRDQRRADRAWDQTRVAGDDLVNAAPSRPDAQKKPCEPPSKIGRTWLNTAGYGAFGSASWIRPRSCSSTRPEPAPTWSGAMAGASAGERLVDAAPHGHWRTTTFVAGLRSCGIIAPLVLDGPMTGEAFRAYVEQFLAPTLSPGDVVVMDNLGAHKVAGVAEAIAAAGASILYLPSYSPDLNLIEQMFAKLKALLRKAAATHARHALGHDRRTARRLHPAGMPQLPRKRRVCVRLNLKCSRPFIRQLCSLHTAISFYT